MNLSRHAVLFSALLSGILVPSHAAEAPRHLSRAALLDKIRGGWGGQMIGVSYGAPTEFRSCGRIGTWDLTWEPGRIENAIHQDDLYVEMTFSKVMDDLGLSATTAQYGQAFRDSKYSLWHANAGARRALALGVPAPDSGTPKYNIHANDIDFQIEADFIGLMCPGLPRASNHFCDRVGRVMNYGDGLYGGMFVAGMYAAAFFESDPRKVVEAGLASIPADSEYARLLRDVLNLSAPGSTDWRAVWQKIEDKWDRDDPCPEGVNAPFNIDAKLNGSYIALGLLFGGGDLEHTMEIATRCGQDSDCNPSSAAGILGVMLGFDRLPARFTSGLPALADTKFEFTAYSFNDIVRSTEQRALKVIDHAGGTATETEVVIPSQSPNPPSLEQWNPGIPDRRVPITDPAWSWTGDWTSDHNGRVSSVATNGARLDFDGVAVAILGGLDQAGGRADVYLDDHKVAVADAYIVERTFDNCLWHTYGLRPGRHSVRLVTRPDHDPRSSGNRIVLTGAVLYRAP